MCVEGECVWRVNVCGGKDECVCQHTFSWKLKTQSENFCT